METQKTKEDNIGKILEYWYTLDFLGQDKFPKVDEPDGVDKFHVSDNADGRSDKKTCKRCLKFDNTESSRRSKKMRSAGARPQYIMRMKKGRI